MTDTIQLIKEIISHNRAAERMRREIQKMKNENLRTYLGPDKDIYPSYLLKIRSR